MGGQALGRYREQEIIGYGEYTINQSHGKKSEWFMVGLAVQKKHISVYVNAVEDGECTAEKYRSELGKVKVGKSSISFSRLEDLDVSALRKVLMVAREQAGKYS